MNIVTSIAYLAIVGISKSEMEVRIHISLCGKNLRSMCSVRNREASVVELDNGAKL
jgi:hypothetical protein